MGERKKTGTAPRTRQASKHAEIDQFLATKQHPLEGDIQSVRKLILGADASIREEIKWNSVSFRNDHDFFATVNLRSIESVQLVFHTGVKKKATADTGVEIDDPHGLIEKWSAKDRCIVTLGKGAVLKGNKAALAALVKDWIRFVGPPHNTLHSDR
jgi:hypothetical protein